jgi:hypothetical protein
MSRTLSRTLDVLALHGDYLLSTALVAGYAVLVWLLR